MAKPMMKYRTVKLADKYDDIDFLKLQAEVDKIKAENPEGESFKIDLNAYEDFDNLCASIELNYFSPETAKEKAEREKRTQQRLEAERQKYLELKKKFG